MKVFLLAVFVACFAGCGLLQALEGGSGGSTAATTTGAGGSGAATGTNCGVDPDTSATLCLGNTLCPSLTIDTEAYPGCGFRIAGATVDIECSCSGFLCPLGASSCSDAQSKLADENLGVVCAQLSAGTCVEGTPVATTTSASTSGGTCDTTCRDECGGEPTCLQQCGC